MPQDGFEPTIPASKREQTNASDRAATGTGFSSKLHIKYQLMCHRERRPNPFQWPVSNFCSEIIAV